MAKLQSTHEFLGNTALSIDMCLSKVENRDNWEGWLYYSLKVENSGDVCLEIIDCSIHESDIQHLIKALRDNQPAVIEPMEPDFSIQLQPIDKNETQVIIFVDEGIRRKVSYTGLGFGGKLIVNPAALNTFADDLAANYERLRP